MIITQTCLRIFQQPGLFEKTKNEFVSPSKKKKTAKGTKMKRHKIIQCINKHYVTIVDLYSVYYKCDNTMLFTEMFFKHVCVWFYCRSVYLWAHFIFIILLHPRTVRTSKMYSSTASVLCEIRCSRKMCALFSPSFLVRIYLVLVDRWVKKKHMHTVRRRIMEILNLFFINSVVSNAVNTKKVEVLV